MLHIVNKSPAETTSFASCLRLSLPGQALLLIHGDMYRQGWTAAVDAKIHAAATPLAKAILEGKFGAKDTIHVSCDPATGGIMRFAKG